MFMEIINKNIHEKRYKMVQKKINDSKIGSA